MRIPSHCSGCKKPLMKMLKNSGDVLVVYCPGSVTGKGHTVEEFIVSRLCYERDTQQELFHNEK